jgi:molecular chaperone GrpE (heat shock protein)
MNSDELPVFDQATVERTVPDSTADPAENSANSTTDSSSELTELQQQVQALRQEIEDLRAVKAQVLQQQLNETQAVLGRLVQQSLSELEHRKQSLQIAVEQLERRQERVAAEMRKSFAGVSQDLAIRVQGFKDYLVNSLQDLVLATEQLELTPKVEAPEPAPSLKPGKPQPINPKFAEQGFQEQARQIRKLLDQYRTTPNYYGAPWQLRRTFEPIHAERVSTWFFTLGGRGALRSMGSRLQNILVASALISILRHLYGDRVRSLILANSPERLGDWRRGLQDCLGISRSDFGPERGVALFESADSLAQKADRLIKEDQLPLILIDDSEEQVSLSMLQFPLWMAFASEPQLRQSRSNFDLFE